MLTKQLVTSLPKICRRNIGIVAPAMNKVSDPIQQLFLDKVREYKSKSVDGKLVDPTPEIEKEIKAEFDKLAKQYGGSSGQMSEFPNFKFTDPQVETSVDKM